MGAVALAVSVVDAVAREAMLFAAIGFVVGGLDDLAIDLVYWVRRGWRRVRHGRQPAPVLADYPVAADPPRLAVFVAAWDESAVIGAMLTRALARFDYPDYRLYVGAYPNDPATIAAIADVAEGDARVRLVICTRPGPTTKADCLNHLWRALLRDEAAEGRGVAAVILHDAEDLVHPGELRLYAAFIADHDVVQLPVLPLVDRRSRMVSGHYCDEFAEAHGKQMPVREALGAGMPLAGVGCAVARPMLARIAAARGGLPFDEGSLTEDYELGLTIARMYGRAKFAWVPESAGALPVAVRAYFPATVETAVRQKTRWMVGIALAGWDRVGWSRAGDLSEHWMRMRDRRAPVALLVLAAAYLALVAWALSTALHALAGTALPPAGDGVVILLLVNLVLLVWRIAMRMWFVHRSYGVIEAWLSVPRIVVANIIALLAARRALVRYVAMLRGAATTWDKTAHHFPDTDTA